MLCFPEGGRTSVEKIRVVKVGVAVKIWDVPLILW